jgi:hypothetical protein
MTESNTPDDGDQLEAGDVVQLEPVERDDDGDLETTETEDESDDDTDDTDPAPDVEVDVDVDTEPVDQVEPTA